LSGKELAFSTFGFEEGSEYLVRVRASDGVNGAEDVSDGMFAISSTAPPPAQPGPESYLVVEVVLVALALGLVIWMKLKPGK